MINLNPDIDIQLGGGGTSDEKIASQKAVKEYTDNSFEAPTSLTINGPASITTTAGAGEADYTISNDPVWASGFKDVQVTCTDTRVTISSVTKRSFHIAVAGFSSSADIILNLSATGNNGTTITATKTVNVVYIFVGVGIKHATNGNIYSATEWTTQGFASSDALGIAVSDGTHGLILSKDKTSKAWSVPDNVLITGDITTVTSMDEAKKDFNGKANTDTILAAVGSSLTSAPAAQWCRDKGENWYLPGAGELLLVYNNKAAVNECLTACGGTAISTDDYYWPSTQFDSDYAWVVLFSNGGVRIDNKHYDNFVRSCAPLF